MKIPKSELLRADYAATRGVPHCDITPRPAGTRLDKVDLGKLANFACNEILAIEKMLKFNESGAKIVPVSLSTRCINELKSKGYFPPYSYPGIEIKN